MKATCLEEGNLELNSSTNLTKSKLLTNRIKEKRVGLNGYDKCFVEGLISWDAGMCRESLTNTKWISVTEEIKRFDMAITLLSETKKTVKIQK